MESGSDGTAPGSSGDDSSPASIRLRARLDLGENQRDEEGGFGRESSGSDDEEDEERERNGEKKEGQPPNLFTSFDSQTPPHAPHIDQPSLSPNFHSSPNYHHSTTPKALSLSQQGPPSLPAVVPPLHHVPSNNNNKQSPFEESHPMYEYYAQDFSDRLSAYESLGVTAALLASLAIGALVELDTSEGSDLEVGLCVVTWTFAGAMNLFSVIVFTLQFYYGSRLKAYAGRDVEVSHIMEVYKCGCIDIPLCSSLAPARSLSLFLLLSHSISFPLLALAPPPPHLLPTPYIFLSPLNTDLSFLPFSPNPVSFPLHPL